MSAKQSLDYSNWVRHGVANLLSPNRGKTLKPRSVKPDSTWKRVPSKRLDKVITPDKKKNGKKGCDAKDRVAMKMNTKVAS